MNSQSIDTRKKTGKLLFEIGILIITTTIVIGLGIYQSILSNWSVASDGDVFFQAFIQSGSPFILSYLNQESLYIQVLSVFFSFLGNKEELVLVFNLILQLLGIVFFYFGVKKICSFRLSIIVLFAGLIAGISVFPLNTDTPMHLIWMLSGFVFWLCTCFISGIKGMYSKYLLPGIVIGLGCYIDLVGFFLFITVILLIFFSKGYSRKEKSLQFYFYLLCFINSFFIMFYLWNDLTFNKRLFFLWLEDRLYSLGTPMGLYQNISIGILFLLCIFCFLLSTYGNKEMVSENNENISEQVTSVVLENMNSDEVKVENIVMETSLNLNDDKDKKQINYIPNPLPLPKKHVKKEMTYAFEPSPDMMHYDYNNYRFDDDYDLKEI